MTQQTCLFFLMELVVRASVVLSPLLWPVLLCLIFHLLQEALL